MRIKRKKKKERNNNKKKVVSKAGTDFGRRYSTNRYSASNYCFSSQLRVPQKGFNEANQTQRSHIDL